MTLTEWDAKHVRVELINNRAEEWGYSTHYSVQVLLDGIWYMIPEIPGEWLFPEIAIILPAGGTNKEFYDLERYGKLPKGTYRLEKEGMAVEFEVKE